MAISDFLKTGAGIAAIAGSGGLAAGLGLAGSLFGQSSSSRLRASRDSAQQAARERFDPSIYQPLRTQGQTMATEGLGRMEDIARERTVASLFRQQPQPMGSSARDLAMRQQQSGMARQALAGFEGQLTQADIARRQEGEMMATQAETQMRDTRAQRESALNNIESMYQAERGARRDKTIGALLGTAGQLGASYLMGRAMRPDGVLSTEIGDQTKPTGTVNALTDPMREQLVETEANLSGAFGDMDTDFESRLDLPNPLSQEEETNIANIFGDIGGGFESRLEAPVPQNTASGVPNVNVGGVQGPVSMEDARSMYRENQQEIYKNAYEATMSPEIREELRRQTPEFKAYENEIQRITSGRVTQPSSLQRFWDRRDNRENERAMSWAESQGIQIQDDTPQYSAGDTGEMPEWLRETFENQPTTIDPMSDEVQNTFSGIESEYNLPEGLLRGIMMTETSGRPEFAMDYHYGEGSDSTAFGMFGITRPTAMDAGFGVDSLLTEQGQSLRDVPWQDQARFTAQYLSALIEREGSLERALDRYGTGIGSGYNQRVMGQINQ